MNETPIYKTLRGIIGYIDKDGHHNVEVEPEGTLGLTAGDQVFIEFPQHPEAAPLSGKVLSLTQPFKKEADGPYTFSAASVTVEQDEDVNATYKRLDEGNWKEEPFHARVSKETLSWLIRENYFDANYPGDTDVEFLPDGTALAVGTIPQEEEEAA